jgi:hypothetical protein
MRSLKALLLINLLILIQLNPVKAGPPFNTDDPEPVPFRHWEFYLSSIDFFQPNSSSGTLPHLETNYGVVPNVQLHLLIPFNYLKQNSRFDYGYANTEMGIKLRFLNLKKSKIQLGLFPVFQVPTIKNENFSNNHVSSFIPLWFQKDWDKLSTYGGAGYCFNPGNGNKDWQFAGWQAQYDFTDKLSLGAEVFYRTATTTDSKNSLGFNLGGFVNFSERFHLIFSAGQNITGEKGTMAYLGLLWTI